MHNSNLGYLVHKSLAEILVYGPESSWCSEKLWSQAPAAMPTLLLGLFFTILRQVGSLTTTSAL